MTFKYQIEFDLPKRWNDFLEIVSKHIYKALFHESIKPIELKNNILLKHEIENSMQDVAMLEPFMYYKAEFVLSN